MPTPSAAAWPIRASTASRVLRLTLAVAVLLAIGLAGANGSDQLARLRVEQHDGYDRLVIPFGERAESGASNRPPPLLRRGDNAYRVLLPKPLAPITEVPRGLASFTFERNADGSLRAIDLSPAPGAHLRYRSLADGIALDVVHGMRSAPPVAAAPPATVGPAGPLPPRIVHAGILFSAARLAALRLGDELVLIMPMQSDLDPAAIPPARVAAVTTGEQGRHRLVRLQLRPDTRIEIAREGAQQWRLGFGPDALAVPARTRFAAEGRSVLVDAEAGTVEFVTLTLPELGAVAVVLTAQDWAMAPARSPYLDVLEAVVGGVVVPRTDSLAIERRPDGIVISSISRGPGG